MKKNINFLDIFHHSFGNERRRELYHELLDNSTFLPKTVEYKDIDSSFKEWVKEKIKLVSDGGIEFPTMTLYSNQRFSEYSQTWEYVDKNNNLLLNFKTVTRDNNPQKGEMNGNIYNIPGEHFFTMKKGVVLDDNGTESFKILKMKLPTPINFVYKVSVFTNKYDKLNEFNTILNKLFAGRQCYINPNGHYMPMLVDSIDDKSEYNIDDRQFYGQTFSIKVLGYVITEEDYRIEEVPLKRSATFIAPWTQNKIRRASVEIEEPLVSEMFRKRIRINDLSGKTIEIEDAIDNNEVINDDNPCFDDSPDYYYYYKPLVITITFSKCVYISEFTIDTSIEISKIELVNVQNNVQYWVNGEKVSTLNKLEEGDNIKIKIKSRESNKIAIVKIEGVDPNTAYDSRNDYAESELDENKEEEINILN